MCPLRFILIFLSATLAGFFLLRNLGSQPLPADLDDDDDDVSAPSDPQAPHIANPSLTAASKVRTAIESVFWTFVDMASGRYLWRHMVSSSKRSN